MKRSKTPQRYCIRRPSRIAIVLLCCALLVGSPGWSGEPAQRARAQQAAQTAPMANLMPFVDIVPDSNGTDLLINAGGVGQLGGTVVANIRTGPTGDKGGWTMTYSETLQTYFATATGFTPASTEEAPLNITTTLGLDTGAVLFKRAYVPASTAQTITSVDGDLQLNLVTTDTITSNTYIAIVPSFAPPGPAPAGHRFIGNIYSARASGALVRSGKPMLLRLAYDPTTLGGADPHSLAIFGWDASPDNKHWDNLGGQLFANQGYVSVATTRFSTFALMATTAWRDDFEDFSLSGIDQGRSQNISQDVLGDNLALALQDTPGQGIAVSRPITPTSVISGWDSLTFSGVATAPTTSIAVDVLSADGTTVLLSNVASGASLASIDPAQHPAIRLRARLASSAAGQSPKLDAWQVRWQPVGGALRFVNYLPALMR